MELNYSDYMKYIDTLLQEETIRKIVREVNTFGKFTKSDDGGWQPAHYAGYTCITTPLDVEGENKSHRLIYEVQEKLLKNLTLAKIVPAPANTLHMTVARLISGNIFDDNIMNVYEQEFLNVVGQLLSHISIDGPLQFEIKGIVVSEHGVIMALVTPVSEEDYLNLQAFRNEIYNDKVLMNLGVERKRSFKGHITLGYIEEELTAREKDSLADLIIDINNEYFFEPVAYQIIRAEIRRFHNFLRFYREDSWPAYDFA